MPQRPDPRVAIGDAYDRRIAAEREREALRKSGERVDQWTRRVRGWSADYCCPACKHGIGISVYLDNEGEVKQIIPDDECRQCGQGKPFFYKEEVGVRNIRNFLAVGGFHGSKQ